MPDQTPAPRPSESATAAWVVVVAQKRWMHGRLRQLARHVGCRLRGHRWGVAKWLDDGVLSCRCERRCGAHRLLPRDTPFAVSYDELVDR